MQEIQLPVNDLKTVLIGLSRIISRQNSLPVLGYVQVERSTAGAVTLTANNLDQAAVVSLDTDGKGEACSILVPLKDLSLIVKRCSKGDTISVQSDEKLSVPSGAFGILWAAPPQSISSTSCPLRSSRLCP